MTECVKSQQDQSTTEKKTESEKETNVREAGLHGDLVPKNPIGKLSDEAFMTGTLIRDPAQEDEPLRQKRSSPTQVLRFGHASHNTIDGAGCDPMCMGGGGVKRGLFVTCSSLPAAAGCAPSCCCRKASLACASWNSSSQSSIWRSVRL